MAFLIAHSLRMWAFRIRLLLTREYWLARLNLAYLNRYGVGGLVKGHEAEGSDTHLSAILVLAIVHHHCAATLTLIQAALAVDAAVCLRSAIEATALFHLLSTDSSRAEKWFRRQHEYSPSEVRRLIAMPEPLTSMYRDLSNLTHPNVRGIFWFISRPAPRKLTIHVGQHPRGGAASLLKLLLVVLDWADRGLQRLPPTRGGWFHESLRHLNHEYWASYKGKLDIRP